MLAEDKMDKKQLRQRIQVILEGISKEEWGRRSRYVERRIYRLPEYKQAKTIVIYWPLPKEVDLRRFIQRAKEEGKTIGLPALLKEDKIDILEFTNEEEMIKGKLGIMHPDRAKSRKIKLEEIDLVVLPGIAFDKKGNRLGRGKGWYDNFLSQLPSIVKKIGVALSPQILDSLPVEPSDEKVDLVIAA